MINDKEMMDCYSHDAVTRSHRLTFTRLNVCSFAGASSWEHPCDEKARRKLRRARRRQFSPTEESKEAGRGAGRGIRSDATARADTETTAADSTPSLSQTRYHAHCVTPPPPPPTPPLRRGGRYRGSGERRHSARRPLRWQWLPSVERGRLAQREMATGRKTMRDYNFDDDDLKVQMVYLEDYLTEDGEEGDCIDDKCDNDNKRRQRAEKKSTTTKGLSTAENDEPPSNQKVPRSFGRCCRRRLLLRRRCRRLRPRGRSLVRTTLPAPASTAATMRRPVARDPPSEWRRTTREPRSQRRRRRRRERRRGIFWIQRARRRGGR